MAIPVTFRTIKARSEAVYTDKGSKFIGIALPVQQEEEIKEQLKRIKSEYKGARHYCYAFILGEDGSHQRSNDDGEPGGTAGKPILNQILSHQFTQCLVVVVRYFGGVLLGTSGLIQAYKTAAREALDAAEPVEVEITRSLLLQADYAALPVVMNLLKRHQIKPRQQDDAGLGIRLEAQVPVRLYDQLCSQLAEISGTRMSG